ncbi:MAG: DUF1573 domain-containing protein [Desulfamplus sp.]|nr:DUF1573 domain-containing protein [Desulfamplus sp.]
MFSDPPTQSWQPDLTPSKMKWTCLLLLLLLDHPALFAQKNAAIQWKHEKLSISGNLQQEEFLALFPFTNIGNSTLIFDRVKTSCECTTIQFSKKNYAPGEDGVIAAKFIVGSLIGVQNKTLWVTYLDHMLPPSRLYLEIQLPMPLQLSPSRLTWRPEDPLQEKTIIAEVPEQEPDMALTKEIIHLSPPGEFAMRFQILVPGRKWKISLTPLDKKQA